MKSRGAADLIIGQFGIGRCVWQQAIRHPAAKKAPYAIWQLPRSGKRPMANALRTATESTIRAKRFILTEYKPGSEGSQTDFEGIALGLDAAWCLGI